MALFERVRMPSFAGATEWLNSEPLGPAELGGLVVLLAMPVSRRRCPDSGQAVVLSQVVLTT